MTAPEVVVVEITVGSSGARVVEFAIIGSVVPLKGNVVVEVVLCVVVVLSGAV